MTAKSIYVTKPHRVKQCLENLREQQIHRNFIGYLAVVYTAAKFQRLENLQVSFRSFFDTFCYLSSNPSKPYVYVFTESTPSEHNLWQNRNVAGSYAPSSVRADSPFRQAIEISGSGNKATYSLKKNHWELAKKHLVYGNKVPALQLAVFLYRNYALTTYPPAIADWVKVFRNDFGYSTEDGEATNEFQSLYRDDSDSLSSEDWLDEPQS